MQQSPQDAIGFSLVSRYISIVIGSSSSFGGKMKKSKLLLGAILLVVLALEGCATARGVGEDLQSLGRAIRRVFSE